MSYGGTTKRDVNASGPPNGVMLATGNRMLEETVAAQINWQTDPDLDPDEREEREPIHVQLCDFDDVSYVVDVAPENTNVLRVQMSLPCWRQIKDHGAEERFKARYGAFVSEPDAQYDIAIDVDMTTLDTEEKRAETIQLISHLKQNVVGGFFYHYFDALAEGKSDLAHHKVDLRNDTTLYMLPSSDRVVVVYGLDFVDRVDQAIARVFMREFVDVKKQLGRAPPCTFNVAPPRELSAFGIEEPTGNLGFITFAILKSHIDDPKRRAVVVHALQTFRNFIQYHLKCSKSYFHARMRAQVRKMLRVLARAKHTAEESEEIGRKVVRRTATGRVFKR